MPKNQIEPEIIYHDFPGQRHGEEVAAILLKHWYTLVLPLLGCLAVITVSVFLPIWGGIAGYIFRYGFTALVYYLWLVGWVVCIVHFYHIWHRHRYILTSERVIAIYQRNAFNREVSEIELERIQSITHSIRGPAATMFGFGDVTLQAAGGQEVKLKQIPYPAEVLEEITHRMKLTGSESRVDRRAVKRFIEEG